MTQTFTDLNYHITFGTKGRRSSIPEEARDDLCKYMGGIVKGNECHPLEINAVEDHAHLLIRVPPKLALSEVLRAVKAGSSKWMNDNVARNREFGWQDGFGAFSVSHSLLPRVGEYVQNQAEHHRRKSFRDELMLLLKRHGIDFDERYLPGERARLCRPVRGLTNLRARIRALTRSATLGDPSGVQFARGRWWRLDGEAMAGWQPAPREMASWRLD